MRFEPRNIKHANGLKTLKLFDTEQQKWVVVSDATSWPPDVTFTDDENQATTFEEEMDS